jgi:hypothetical protein
MEFRTVVASGREVLFVGHERGNSKPPEAWLEEGRWRLAIPKLGPYLSDQLKEKSFGASIGRFVFCFEIADFEFWSISFQSTSDYTSYRPKRNEIWSVGQLRWSDVKLLGAEEQLQRLRGAIQAAILRIGTKRRKPRDFDYVAFAGSVDFLLSRASVECLRAAPAV